MKQQDKKQEKKLTCKDCDSYCPRFNEFNEEYGFCAHWDKYVMPFRKVCSNFELIGTDADLPTYEEWQAIGKDGVSNE